MRIDETRGRKKAPTVNMETFIEKANRFFDALLEEELPEEIQREMRAEAEMALASVRKELGTEAAALDQAWMDGFMARYEETARKRLVEANRAAVMRMTSDEMSETEITNLVRKLRGWGQNRAANMARFESALAANEAMVAGYRTCGYTSIWKSAPGCCKICVDLNGQTVGKLKPPLHKGCACTVAKGERILPNLRTDDIIIDSRQIGHKIGRHVKDFGMNPSSEKDRKVFVEITREILDGADEVRVVPWQPDENGHCSIEVLAYIKGSDVVLVDFKKKYITTMKDGATNKKVMRGRTVKKRED